MLHHSGIKENKIAEDIAMEYLGHQFCFILWLRLKAKVQKKKKKGGGRNNDYLTSQKALLVLIKWFRMQLKTHSTLFFSLCLKLGQ